MTPTLSHQQRVALEANEGAPVPVVDERTQAVYYLISAKRFDELQAHFTQEEFDQRAHFS